MKRLLEVPATKENLARLKAAWLMGEEEAARPKPDKYLSGRPFSVCNRVSTRLKEGTRSMSGPKGWPKPFIEMVYAVWVSAYLPAIRPELLTASGVTARNAVMAAFRDCKAGKPDIIRAMRDRVYLRGVIGFVLGGNAGSSFKVIYNDATLRETLLGWFPTATYDPAAYEWLLMEEKRAVDKALAKLEAYELKEKARKETLKRYKETGVLEEGCSIEFFVKVTGWDEGKPRGYVKDFFLSVDGLFAGYIDRTAPYEEGEPGASSLEAQLLKGFPVFE